MAERLMLDPSLLLSGRTFAIAQAAWQAGQLEGVVLPASFVGAIVEGRLSLQTLRFFRSTLERHERVVPDPVTLARFVRQTEVFGSDGTSERPFSDTAFSHHLRSVARDSLVYQILAEEWQFMTSSSWIASRIKRPFSAFVASGAVAVEWGAKMFDHAAAKVLKIPAADMPGPLAIGQRLRFLSKWIAVSGLGVLPLMQPIVATVSGLVAGYFLLFDP
jgi:hypothetical protein